MGGTKYADKTSLWVPPMIVESPNLESRAMKEELFCPILPIVPFTDFNEVLNKHINTRSKPLAIYYFGHSSDQNFKTLITESSSGALILNDLVA